MLTERLEILKNYKKKRDSKYNELKNEYKKQFETYVPYIQEILYLDDYMKANEIPSHTDNDKRIVYFVSNSILRHDSKKELRMCVNRPYLKGIYFCIDEWGKYYLSYGNKETRKIERVQDEVQFLEMFLTNFPRYKDNFFDYVDKFERKEP